MNLTDLERETFRAMRAVTINGEGHEIFVGLEAAESAEFLELSRRHEAGEDMNTSPRFRHLTEKHEEARQRIVEGEVPLDRSNLREAP